MAEYQYYSQIRALQLKEEIDDQIDEIHTQLELLVDKYPFFYIEIRVDPQKMDDYFKSQCTYTTNIFYD